MRARNGNGFFSGFEQSDFMFQWKITLISFNYKEIVVLNLLFGIVCIFERISSDFFVFV